MITTFDPQLRRDLQRGRRDIVFFAWRFLGLKLHPGQIRFLRQADGLVNVLVPGNRFGKTVIIAVRHIWFNFYKIGVSDSNGEEWQKFSYRTACLAPDGKILGVDYRIITEILESRFKTSPDGEPIVTNKCAIGWYLVSKIKSPQYQILFRDNSSIEFYSTSDDKGTKLQGDFYGYGSYDEGGRSHHLYLELNQNIGQRLSQMAAPLDLVSTPAMDSPSLVYHHEIFQKGLRGEGGFKSFEGSAYENRFLPQHYFEREELRLKGDPLYDQVFFGKFVFAGDTLYKAEDVNRGRNAELNGGIRYEEGHKYVIATDTSISSDEQVDTVLDVPANFDIEDPNCQPLRTVRINAHKGSTKSHQVAMQDHIDLWEAYDKARNVSGILETFNEGSIRWWQDLPDGIRRRTKCYGSYQPPSQKLPAKYKTGAPTTNSGKKVDMLIALRKVLQAGKLQIPDDNKELIEQLIMYREDDKNLRTDRIISLALACWMVLEGKPATPIAKAVPLTNW